MPNFATARRNMVDSQLRPNRVADEALLEAFSAVPRERFVPEERRSIAYIDEDIPIGHGRALLEPVILGRLLIAAEIEPTDMVLHVGCGYGYATAVLARLSAMVVAVDDVPEFVEGATAALEELAVDNAVVVSKPLEAGYPEQGPYQVILIDGAVSQVPDAIANQLDEGGRLVTVRHQEERVGQAILMKRAGGIVSDRILFDASTPLLPNFLAEPGFVF